MIIGINWQQQNGDIIDLPEPVTTTLYIVDGPAIFPNRPDLVSLIRFIPADWWKQLDMEQLLTRWVSICKYALWENEPDIEPANGYEPYASFWIQLGGIIVDAPYHDEKNNTLPYDIHTIKAVHCYGSDLGNLKIVPVEHYKEVWVTEYGVPFHPEQDLQLVPELENLGSSRVYLFTYQWIKDNNRSGYDIRGTTFLPIPVGGNGLKVVNKTAYATELGPDGQGHARCGAASLASDLLAKGWNSDPYQLMVEVAAKLPGIEQNGMTSQQMLDIASQYQLTGRLWYNWQDAIDALNAGKHVHCLVDNWYLRPRNYPAGGGWDDLHWIKLVAETEADFFYIYDPLTYMTGEYPVPYQGPTVALGSSIRLAIQGTPNSEAGVIID